MNRSVEKIVPTEGSLLDSDLKSPRPSSYISELRLMK